MHNAILNKSLLALLFGASLTVLLSAGQASASGLTISGASCQPVYGPETALGQGLSRSAAGIRYGGSSSVLVVCPLPRINVGNTRGAGIYPSNTRGGSSTAISTWVYAADFYGNIVSSMYFAIPSLAAGQQYTAPLSVSASTAWGNYSMLQILSNNDVINQIQLSE